ncbi:MAG TPA: hypothetical protein VMY34_06065 [Acidimicrobiales bacterium]|nr:hypothetical protein [Acidimicrobiales bacterium]
MPMRVTCKFYESRTYASGETVHQCRLDLAPEAPWRCPADCSSFAVRMVDVGFVRGSLGSLPLVPEPRLDESTASLLDEAENIVNAVGPGIVDEVRREKAAQVERADRGSGWRRFLTKRRRG